MLLQSPPNSNRSPCRCYRLHTSTMEQPTSASGNGSTYTNQRIRREEGWGVPTSRVAAPLCPHQPAEDSACRRRRRRPWKALRASPLGPAAADGSESSVADLARLNGRTSTRTGSPFSSWRRRRPVQHRREDSRPRATGTSPSPH